MELNTQIKGALHANVTRCRPHALVSLIDHTSVDGHRVSAELKRPQQCWSKAASDVGFQSMPVSTKYYRRR
jgi:hypothetical protein